MRLDGAQFFPTIDHGPRDGPYLPGDDLFAPHARRVGLPLGSLTSQRWANRPSSRLRARNRSRNVPSNRNNTLGVRCVAL